MEGNVSGKEATFGSDRSILDDSGQNKDAPPRPELIFTSRSSIQRGSSVMSKTGGLRLSLPLLHSKDQTA